MLIDPRLLFMAQTVAKGISLIGISDVVYPPVLTNLQFSPSVTPAQQTQCLADAQVFNWQQNIQNNAPPIITPGPNAGTGSTITIAGTCWSFQVVLLTGTSVAAGSLFTVSFSTFWLSIWGTRWFSISPADNNSAIVLSTLPLWVTNTSTGFVVNSGSGKLSAKTTYTFNFNSCPN